MADVSRRLGDRYDGRRLRHTPAFFSVIPHIMKRRSDSLIAFDEYIEIDQLEKYVRHKRKEEQLPGFSTFHLIMAAAVRMIALRPWLNRFVIAGKIYARNALTFSLSVKRGMTHEAEETTIKPEFSRSDTVYDVYRSIQQAIEKDVLNGPEENRTDSTARLLSHCPAWLLRLVVNLMTFLDHRGLMPKALQKVSPFHTSLYLTDVGSLGIGPVYHHIFDFGTTSIFLALGKKETMLTRRPDGSVEEIRIIRLRFVVDERICDGYYYAESIRSMKKLLRHPERLEQPPGELPVDTWI